MRVVIFKKIFIIISYSLFLIGCFFSDIENFIAIMVILGIYSIGLHWCYGYIFNIEINFYNATLKLEDKYSRIFAFLCGIFIMLSILFSMLGFVEILDFDKLVRVTEN